MKRMSRKFRLLITHHRVITEGRLGGKFKRDGLCYKGRWF